MLQKMCLSYAITYRKISFCPTTEAVEGN